MSTHLQRELDHLKVSFLELVHLVEGTIDSSLNSLRDMNPTIAQSVIDSDDDIDQMEIKVEEECLKLLALYQPVAGDLRFVVAILKINNDLERIGDLGVNIAKRVLILAEQGAPVDTKDFPVMYERVLVMLRSSLDALVRRDSSAAKAVKPMDREVDILKSKIEIKILDSLKENPSHSQSFLCILSICRHLERIADHATNIAEDVIYMVDGDITRHQHP